MTSRVNGPAYPPMNSPSPVPPSTEPRNSSTSPNERMQLPSSARTGASDAHDPRRAGQAVRGEGVVDPRHHGRPARPRPAGRPAGPVPRALGRAPWAGTFADVELVARRLAAGLRGRGVGPGDVIAFQLPNWMEAAAVFWASAFLGAVVVPIVHFYGRKEVGYILDSVAPRVFVTAQR